MPETGHFQIHRAFLGRTAPKANSMHSAANSRNSVDGSKPSKVGSPFFSFCIDTDQTCSYSPMSGTDGVYQHQTRAVLLLGDNNLFRWATNAIDLRTLTVTAMRP